MAKERIVLEQKESKKLSFCSKTYLQDKGLGLLNKSTQSYNTVPSSNNGNVPDDVPSHVTAIPVLSVVTSCCISSVYCSFEGWGLLVVAASCDCEGDATADADV